MYRGNKRFGFSLPELLIGSSLAFFAISTVVSLGYMGRVFFQDSMSQTSIQSKGKFAMERVARELRSATNTSILSNGDRIDISTFDIATSSTIVSRYYLVQAGAAIGGQTTYELRYVPDTSLQAEEVVATNLVKDTAVALFSNNAGNIRVKFEIRETFLDNQFQTIHIDSQIRPRNI